MGRMIRIGLTVILITMIGIGAYLWQSNPEKNNGNSPVRHTPPPRKEGSDHPRPVDKPRLPSPPDHPFTLLLVGVDQRKGDAGRTDAIMLLSVDPRNASLKVLNIPRDTKTRIHLGNGHYKLDKINHAYSLGHGMNSTVDAVEAFLDIPVNHYMKVNMRGFRELVNLFGGVKVEVPRSFSYKGHHFRRGTMALDGSQALAYIRDRTGNSDFDRHKRQQQVMQSLWKKARHPSILFKMDDLVRLTTRHVETSLSVRDLWRMLSALKRIPEQNVEILRLTGRDQWRGRYYLIVPDAERRRVSHILRRHLGLDPPPKDLT